MVFMNSRGSGALAPQNNGGGTSVLQNGIGIKNNGAKTPSPRALVGGTLVPQKILMRLKSHPQYLYKIELNKKSIVVQQIRATTRKFRIVQNSVVSNFFTTKIKKERLNNE